MAFFERLSATSLGKGQAPIRSLAELIAAAKAGKTDTYSRFDIAGFLTETILVGTLAAWPLIQALGAVLGLGVISGAIVFHLFTPLGISVRNADGSFDGGQLFGMACLVWLSCLLIIVVRRRELLGLLGTRRPMMTA